MGAIRKHENWSPEAERRFLARCSQEQRLAIEATKDGTFEEFSEAMNRARSENIASKRGESSDDDTST